MQAPPTAGPCCADGRVVVSTAEGIVCLDAEQGAQRWQFVDAATSGGVSVAGSCVFAARGSQICCLDLATGDVKWQRGADGTASGRPVVDDGQMFMILDRRDAGAGDGAPMGTLLCIDAGTGRCAWEFAAEGGMTGQPTHDGERVFITSNLGFCYGLDRKSGTLCWQSACCDPAAGIAIAQSRLYVTTHNGRVFCLDAATGSLRGTFDLAWHSRAKAHLLSAPVAQGARVYFGAGLDGLIVGLGAPTLYCLHGRVEDW
jgi:outer membrane protein assembly factor BamB